MRSIHRAVASLQDRRGLGAGQAESKDFGGYAVAGR
jgi:hypothetical protein